ncbi:choline transporter [Exophiala viscosa]|uniref:choline transporter n=1 Tax=Exophiala viscosa TaxID=2486360 RepID=UPI00218CA36F|nr:choline transporter [Exophiala viscosa]
MATTVAREDDKKDVGIENVVSPEKGEGEVITLAALGLEEETRRNISAFAIVCAAWNICNCWAGVAATSVIGITQGGTIVVLYGLIVVFVLDGATILTLAELASVYPTAGGQYHWTSILSPPSVSKGLSYICGATNIFGWIATSAGIAIIPAQITFAIVVFFDEDYEASRWKVFLLYQAFNLLFMANNIYYLKRSIWVHNIGLLISLGFFIIIFISCLALAPTKNSSTFVWSTYVNLSNGWPDGLVFFFGLVNPTYAYSGIDGALHLAEECANAAVAVPRALMWTLLLGFLSAFPFMIAMLYCIQDLDGVLGTPTGQPMYELWYQATSSEAAATVFISILLLGGFFALNAAQQTASRLTWAFARDDGLIFSHYLSRIHPRYEAPVWSLLFNAFVVFLMGFVYLGSTTAFNALIGSGLILQQITFAIPAGLLMWQKRSATFLPKTRSFRLPGVVGWVANILTVLFGLIVLVFFDFPTVLPVTGSTMNYTCVVLGTMAIFATINWFVHARGKYHGPRLPRSYD